MNDQDDPARQVDCAPGPEPDATLLDGPLLDLLDALVEQRGRVPAARVLGVNYRTLALFCDSRQVSHRMRRALLEFRDRCGDAGGEAEGGAGGPVDVDGDNRQDDEAALRGRVAELEDENFRLRELVDGQARQLEDLNRRLAALEDTGQKGDGGEGVDVEVETDEANSQDHGDIVGQDWRPPRRRAGMPDAGIVTLEGQPDEVFAFGPAAALVAEWRQLRVGAGLSVSRVDRAQAAVRRWDLEAQMLGDYRLTLPPDTFPLDDARRSDHVRWRRDALAEAHKELGMAKRARLLRRVLTLGIWRE